MVFAPRNRPSLLAPLLLAAMVGLATGCADSSADMAGPRPMPEWVWGGQTGGLLPACGVPQIAMNGQQVPADGGGVVIHTAVCGEDFDPAVLGLRDAEGNPLSTELLPLGDGAFLLQPEMPLQPGTYTVEGLPTEQTVEVAPPAVMLPTRIGRLRHFDACAAAFEFEPDPTLLPFLSQLRLQVSIDDGPLELWFDYGELTFDEGEKPLLTLQGCSERCLADGSHRIEVIADLAGSSATLEPIQLRFQVSCNSKGGDGAFCALSPSHAGRPPPRWWWLLPSLLALRWRRRRRPPPG